MIWKEIIFCLLDEYNVKSYINGVVAGLVDADPLKAYKKEMGKAKTLILDEVREHVVSHVGGKYTA